MVAQRTFPRPSPRPLQPRQQVKYNFCMSIVPFDVRRAYQHTPDGEKGIVGSRFTTEMHGDVEMAIVVIEFDDLTRDTWELPTVNNKEVLHWRGWVQSEVRVDDE